MNASNGLASAASAFFVPLSLLALSACSPGMFWGGSAEDSGVANTRNYRRVNLACAGMDISSSNIDVPTFRKILHCFNSNGALEPIENLMNRLPDSDVQPLVDVSNKYLLNNRKLLYQLERTYYTLSDKGILDNTLAQAGRLLENEEFVSSLIALLKEGYFVERGPNGYSSDRNLLKAIERLATRITPANVADVGDAALTVARSRVFQSLQFSFRGDSPSGRRLRDLTDGVLGYFQDSGDPHHVDAGLKLLGELVSGSLFAAMDEPEVLGRDPEAFRVTVPRLASVMDAASANGAQILDGVTSHLHYTHRPIHCLKGSQTVPDGAMHIIRELTRENTSNVASFLKRRNLLTLMAMAPFCDFPPQIGEYYPTLYSFADTTAIRPAAELIKAFYRVSVAADADGRETHPLALMMVDILADTGSAEYAGSGGPAENTAGIKRLLPLMAELSERKASEDILLLLAMPRVEDRARIQDALGFLIEPIPGSESQSIYSALSEAITRASGDSLERFVRSLHRFVKLDRPLLDPALTALRQAFHVNDVHPVVELMHDVLTDATYNDKLFNTMFLMSEMPEFMASVRLASDMAKDGRAKELAGALLTIFHKFALKGQTPVNDAVEPAFHWKARHDLSMGDLYPFPIGEEPSVSNDSCRKLDLRVSLGDYWEPPFNDQVNHFDACMNADARHDDFSDVLALLRRERTERGKSYLELLIDMTRDTGFTRDQLGYLGNTFIAAVDDLRMYRVMDALPLFVRGVQGKVAELLRPVIEVFRPVMSDLVRPGVQRLEGFAASVLRRTDFPLILRFIDVTMDQEPEPDFPPAPQDFDWPRIKRWVWNKECENLPAGSPEWMIDRYKNLRLSQIIDDQNKAVTTWDLVDGRARRTWKLADFRELLNPVLTVFGDPAQGAKPGAQVDALLNVMRYFTLPDDKKEPNEFQHYHRDELRRFMMDRSNDHKLMTYFYPGDTRPRVRLVTTMDRLELLLINADFWSPWPFVPGRFLPDFRNKRNFGMLFLSKIANAWGDEPESAWPKVIKEKYRGSRPPTLADAVADIRATSNRFTRLLGFPYQPGCRQVFDPKDPPDVQYDETHDPTPGGVIKVPSWMPGLDVPTFRRALFNIHQTLPVLEESLPKPGVPIGTGGKMVNGMRIMRDLFFELYYSSPEKYRRADFRDTRDGMRNNLSVAMKLVRAGLVREATRHLRGMDPDAPAVKDFFSSLIEGASAVENPPESGGDPRNPRYYARLLIDPLVDPKLESKPVAEGGEPRHDLFWTMIGSIFGVVDAAEGGELDEEHRKELEGKSPDEIKAIRETWAREHARMKQFAFYTVAQAGPLGLIPPVLKTVGPVLRAYHGYLAAKASIVQDLLRSKGASYFMRAMYESLDLDGRERAASVMRDLLNEPRNGLDGMAAVKAIDDDEPAEQGLDAFADRWDILKELPEYKALGLDQVSRDMLDFLEERVPDPAGRSASARLRTYVAERLEQGDLDQLMSLGRRNPVGLHSVAEMLSSHIQDEELKDFVAAARRALESPAPTPRPVSARPRTASSR